MRDTFLAVALVVQSYLLPADVSDLVSSHVEHIFEEGYAEELSDTDFFHGHLNVHRMSCSSYDQELLDVDEWAKRLAEEDPYFTYHTHEREGPRNPYIGPPRSILGFPDGTIQPMREGEYPHYFNNGTIHGTEPFVADKPYNQNGTVEFCRPGTRVQLANGKESALQQFLILPFKQGRYVLEDGTRYDVFFPRYLLDYKLPGLYCC